MDRQQPPELQEANREPGPVGARESTSNVLQDLNPKDATVLVVEDSPDDQLIVGKALQRFGIKSRFVANTAEEGLEFLARRRCDVVLVDYHLPGMNGLRLLEQIRESYPGVSTIMVTSACDENVAAECIKLGASDYIAKNEFLTSGIIRALQAALQERIASHEEDSEAALRSGEDKLGVAKEEADWLLSMCGTGQSLDGQLSGLAAPGHDGENLLDVLEEDSSLRQPDYGEEQLFDMLEAFTRYLRGSFRSFPEPATDEEGALVRMFTERGSSPQQILMVYKASLRCLDAEAIEPAINPLVCVARLLALVLEQR